MENATVGMQKAGSYRGTGGIGAFIQRESVFGYILIFPAMILLTGLVAYPFLTAINPSLAALSLPEHSNTISTPRELVIVATS